ncbi:MAG: type secretion system protein [Dehalococcoidia bacterium]|nr:type secretion system protein [Dehalococcoidia bacterium]
MPYQYLVYTEDGSSIRGTTEGSSQASVEDMLWRNGYYITSIKEVPPPQDITDMFPSLFGVKLNDIIIFTRQLATLVNSGVPILAAMNLLREQVSSPTFRKTLREISTLIEAGSSVSDAIRGFPNIFPPIYGRMVEVGERTGRLERVLEQVALYLEKQQAIMGRIKGALTYPAFILLMASGVIFILVTFALPGILGIFDEFKVELPWTTKLLVVIADFAQTQFLSMLLGLASIAVLFTAALRTPTGRRTFHYILLKSPIIGGIVLKGNLANFTRSMAILIRAGLPLTEIIDLTVETVSNEVLKESFLQVRTGLLQGQGLAHPLEQDTIFPKMMSQMIKVGEESGALDGTLDALADFYEKEADRAINALTSKMEPVLMLVLGGVVGFIALAVITPMYSLIGGIN